MIVAVTISQTSRIGYRGRKMMHACMFFQILNNRSHFLKIWWLKFEHKDLMFYDMFEVGRLRFYDEIADQIVEDVNERQSIVHQPVTHA